MSVAGAARSSTTREATPSQAEFRGADALDPHDADWDDLRETALADHLQQFEAPEGGEFSFDEAETPAAATTVNSAAAAAADIPLSAAVSSMPPVPTKAEDLASFNALFGIKCTKRNTPSREPASSAPTQAQQADLLDDDPDILELQ